MPDSAAINSPDYWNHRFAVDWTARGGAEQTSFFSKLAITMLPAWFWDDAAENALSFVDVGCALGEALPDFRTRLPKSKLAGVDVSKVAIRMARERLPEFSFRAVSEDWSDAPDGDIMFCSNTLEHLKDWKKRLARLGELADKYVLMLVPFQEWTPIDEHVVTFDFTSFPEALPDGKRLLYLRILDAARAPDTHWNGHQALAIYGPKVKAKDVVGHTSLDPYAGADFRGRSAPQVRATLLGLQAAYPGAPAPADNVTSEQALVDRVNAEWSAKLDASVAEMAAKHTELKAHYERILSERDAKLETSVGDLVAKHTELRTHYERVLGERDAKIGQLSELQAWRQRAQDLEAALRDGLTQQLRRSEEQSKDLAEQLIQARLEAERLRAQNLHIEREAKQAAALEVLAIQHTLVSRERELDALRSHVSQEVLNAERRSLALSAALERERTELATQSEAAVLSQSAAIAAAAENAALKMELEALRSAPSPGVSQAPPDTAVLEALNDEVRTLKSELSRAAADTSALRATIRCAVDERDQARVGGVASERLRAIEAELSQAKEAAEEASAEAAVAKAEASHASNVLHNAIASLEPTLDAVRKSWQVDYARLSGRANLLQRHSGELHTQLSRVLTSKSLKIGTSLRRVYWTALGQPNAPSEIAPAALPDAADPGSEFLRTWDRAKQALKEARRNAGSAPATSPPATMAPTSTLPSAPLPTAPVVVAEQQPGGRVIALQAASLGSGGLERVVFDLAIGLKARGETVIAIVVASGGAFADELRQRGIAVHAVERDVATYERVLRENGVTDLFVHHSYFGYERAASLGVRFYDVVHNYYFWHRNSGNMIRRVAELSTQIVYVSAAVRSFHERLFGVPIEKGAVINNPVHLDGLIVPEKAQLLRLREKTADTVFLNVAQAFPSKAQPAMVTAFGRAWRKNPNIRLQIAGAPVKEEAARAVRARIEAEGVGDAVELLGHCDRRKMSRLYAEAHAFVLPSLYEGYSVSAIEAATYGLPLLLTAVGGAEDLVVKSGCGVLLPPATQDLSQLDAQAVERLGLEPTNAATDALETAFLDVAANRAQWTKRGLEAHYDIRTLDDMIDAYVAAMPANRAHA